MKLESFAGGQWVSPGHELAELRSAVTGEVVATATHGGLDMSGVLAYARDVGGPNLRRLTFHQRAELLKKLAQYISERKDQLYKLSFQTGATRTDNMIDVDGGVVPAYTTLLPWKPIVRDRWGFDVLSHAQGEYRIAPRRPTASPWRGPAARSGFVVLAIPARARAGGPDHDGCSAACGG